MAEPDGDRVLYDAEPKIGQPFYYYHPSLAGCISTPVVSIEEIDDTEGSGADHSGE